MLQLRDVRAAHGSVLALHGVSLEVPEGAVVALLGANGAGKSSTLHTIAGLLPLAAGSIRYGGRSIDGLAAEARVRAGIALVPEGRMLFGQLTVRDNLQLGAYVRRDRAGIARDLEQACARFPVLAQRRDDLAALLSGGEQQQLAIARALMSRPRLLLLDDPSLGLAPLVLREVFAALAELSRDGVTVLLADQNANLALGIASSGYVLENGRVALRGSADALRRNDRVRRAYLGD